MIFRHQNKVRLSCVFVMLLMWFSLVVAAVPTKEDAVRAALKAEWDRPNRPLTVPVVVVKGEFAIASWLQAPRGGRALLKFKQRHWQTLFCGDVNLTKAQSLINAGVSAPDAKYLSEALLNAEKQLAVDDKKLVNSFKGIVDLLKEPHHHAH